MAVVTGIQVVPARADEEATVWLETRGRAGQKISPSLDDFRHRERVWTGALHVTAFLDGEPAGAGFVGSFPGTEHETHVGAGFGVVPELRKQGVGTALYRAISEHAASLGKDALVIEVMASEPDSLAWAERRGFAEIERQDAVALDLAEHDPAPADPPPGVEIVTRAERPDLLRGMYEVGIDAGRDIPGLDGAHEQTFEQWASFEVERPSRDPELCFIAVANEDVIGYASLDVMPLGVFHGLTATARAWRRRGVATALKRAQIAAAKERGYERLLTESEHGNEPMRRLNEKLGFRPEPSMSTIVLRGLITPD
jgi:GNAT superfamily N-acetyltransferase